MQEEDDSQPQESQSKNSVVSITSILSKYANMDKYKTDILQFSEEDMKNINLNTESDNGLQSIFISNI